MYFAVCSVSGILAALEYGTSGLIGTIFILGWSGFHWVRAVGVSGLIDSRVQMSRRYNTLLMLSFSLFPLLYVFTFLFPLEDTLLTIMFIVWFISLVTYRN